MQERLDQLAHLEHGWYDGHGEVISPHCLTACGLLGRAMLARGLDPAIGPCDDGTINVQIHPTITAAGLVPLVHVASNLYTLVVVGTGVFEEAEYTQEQVDELADRLWQVYNPGDDSQ